MRITFWRLCLQLLTGCVRCHLYILNLLNLKKEANNMPVYSDMVMDHFMHPRNVGEIENPDGVGEVGNPVCGDMMTFYIKVKDGHLDDVKFKTFGCGAAIA